MEPFVRQDQQTPSLFVLENGVGIRKRRTHGRLHRPAWRRKPSPYDSLNLAFHVGDEPGDIVENRKRTARRWVFSGRLDLR